MSGKNLFIILYITILAFCALYSPQPLLALLSREFQVSLDQAALLITATMLPLSVAPIAYGFILESVPSKTILQWAVFLLALSELPFVWVDQFWVLVAIRGIQGLLLPAIFTALLTYISTLSHPKQLKRNIAAYIATTIFGGFLGRLLAGLMATYLQWHYTFLIIAIGLMIGAGLLMLLKYDARLHFVKPTWHTLEVVLRNPIFNKVYLIIFLIFFCYASLLNLLPFRLTSLDSHLPTITISLMYSGYLIGLFAALGAPQITQWIGNETQTIIIGLIVYLLSILLFALPYFLAIFLTMFMFCIGIFLVHSVLSGYLNQLTHSNKGIVNGLYIASYYTGGTLGSYLPSFIYQSFGWIYYICTLAMLVISAIGIALYLQEIVNLSHAR